LSERKDEKVQGTGEFKEKGARREDPPSEKKPVRERGSSRCARKPSNRQSKTQYKEKKSRRRRG